LNRDIRQQNADSAKAAREAGIDEKKQRQQMREHSIGFWSEWNGVDNPATMLKKYPWAADEPGVKTALTQWSIDQRATARQRAARESGLRREQSALQKRDPETLSEDEKTRLDEIQKQLRTSGQQGIPIRDKKSGRTGMWYDDGNPMPDTIEAIQSEPAGEEE
jgi:hypothetical protein